MKQISEEERQRIFELSKTEWIQCKDYMPEEILPWIEDENYHTPRTWWKDSEWNYDLNCPLYHHDEHQDLHYITQKVLIRTYTKHGIDFRRKFDSHKTFIWNEFEGCYGDYDWYWMQLPELTDEQLNQLKIDEDNCWNSENGQQIAHKKFYKEIEIDEDYINNRSSCSK